MTNIRNKTGAGGETWIQRGLGDGLQIKQAWTARDRQVDKEQTEAAQSQSIKSKETQRQETGEMGTQEEVADGGGGDQERNRFQSCCGGRSEDLATAWLWGGKVREKLVTMTA